MHIKLTCSELGDQRTANKASGTGDRDSGLSMMIQLVNHPQTLINHALLSTLYPESRRREGQVLLIQRWIAT